MKLSVVVSVRGKEPLLNPTIANLRKTAGVPIEVVLVSDGGEYDHLMESDADQLVVNSKSRGCAFSRHRGIMEAKGDLILVCDAHMNFTDNWGVTLKDWMSSNKGNNVVCAPMGSCDYSLNPVKSGLYKGAKITYKSTESINGTTNSENMAMHAQWCDNNFGRISCVMGAFYAFKRTTYINIGSPWKVGTAWGTDEELISIAANLAGDGVHLLNGIEAYHHFREVQPWTPTQTDIFYMWVNRFRVVHVTPMPKEMKNELYAWMSENSIISLFDTSFKNALVSDFSREEVVALKNHLAKHESNWDEFYNKYIKVLSNTNCVDAGVKKFAEHRTTTSTIKPVAQPKQMALEPQEPSRPPQMFVRKAEVCELCDGVNTFSVYRTIPATETTPSRQYLKCKCGNHGVRINLGPMSQSRAAFSDMRG